MMELRELEMRQMIKVLELGDKLEIFQLLGKRDLANFQEPLFQRVVGELALITEKQIWIHCVENGISITVDFKIDDLYRINISE